MCGFAGIFGDEAEGWPATLQAMGAALSHRGPDGQGEWIDNAGIGMVHRRLAIIDLSDAGSQPMVSADGRWVLVFNGEIYNHQEIRSGLEHAGISNWRGHSDTEVLLACIASKGVEATLQLCNGMFAFAVWDRHTRTIVLARDRTGEKPLYVGWVGGDVVFGSELKAFRCHPKWRHSVEPVALELMLSFGFVPAPWSIHPAVYKLPAATMLRLTPADRLAPMSVEALTARLHRYWRLEDVVSKASTNPWQGSQEEALEAIQVALDDAVRLRMLADVPVGAMLSGGIDSSLVVASMARQSPAQVRTFTVGFEEQGIDESDHAAAVARHWNTDHRNLRMPASSAMALIERIPEIYDEPFADAAQLPALLVTEAARGEVTVALTGDGGDELFHGYQRYLDGARAWSVLGRLPEALRRGGASLCREAANAAGARPLAQRLRRQAGRIGASDVDSYYRGLLGFPGAPAVRSGQSLAAAWPVVPGDLVTSGEHMRFIDQRLTLPEGIHTKLDRASSAVGLELRVPLLDHRLVELSWRLPASWHVSGGQGKQILRRLAHRQVPLGASTRRKQGFDVPIAAWLRGPLRSWAEDLLAARELADDPLIDADGIRRLFEDHLANRADNGYALWAVLMYRAWSLRHG